VPALPLDPEIAYVEVTAEGRTESSAMKAGLLACAIEMFRRVCEGLSIYKGRAIDL